MGTAKFNELLKKYRNIALICISQVKKMCMQYIRHLWLKKTHFHL